MGPDREVTENLLLGCLDELRAAKRDVPSVREVVTNPTKGLISLTMKALPRTLNGGNYPAKSKNVEGGGKNGKEVLSPSAVCYKLKLLLTVPSAYPELGPSIKFMSSNIPSVIGKILIQQTEELVRRLEKGWSVDIASQVRFS